MSRKMRKKIQAIMLVFAMVISVFQGIPGLKIDWAPKSSAANALYWPVEGHTSHGALHDKNAIDIRDANIGGATVRAAIGGTVTKKTTCSRQHSGSYGDCNGFGTGLVIKGDDGRTYQYAHMQGGSIPGNIGVGSRVNAAQAIGRVGTTGNSTGNHLHFGICWGQYWIGTGDPTKESYIYGSAQPADRAPRGCLDSVEAAPGQVTVSGWCFDADCTSKAVGIHVYIDGPAGSGKFIGSGVANLAGSDVNRYYGCGDYHRFRFTIQTNYTGNHSIWVHGLSIDANGNAVNNNPHFGSKTVNIPQKISYSVNTGAASDIKNKKAVISGSLSPAGNANSWGFYAGTSENEMKKYTVSASSTNSANMKAQIGNYVTLKPGTKYYYQTWAWVNDQEKKGSVSSFVTTAVKPEIPELKVSVDSKDIGIGDAPEFSWKAVDQADYYKLYLYDENGQAVQESDKITGTKYAFGAVDADGEYSACIEAYNEVGTKGKSEIVSFTVHPDVTVKFMDADSFVDAGDDYEPEVLSEQKVHYGKSATKPADPQHKGYTFSKWVGNYSSVKEDAVVKAEYKINQYKVTYIDSVTNEELGSEKVTYYSSANPVDYSVETGYKKTGYDGWDKDYKHITEDTKLYTCFGWYNDNFPIYATITKAKREYDAQESDNEGYTIEAALKNWDTSTTKGRVVAALKTEEGKLLTTTESSAFSIKKSTTKTLEIFVPYDKAASIAEIYVVGQYKDAVPITTTASNNAMLKIDQKDTYTNWSEEKPAENAKNVESRTEYRYQDKSTTTSYETSLAGYTQSGGSWVRSGGGSIDYVSSFPAGFNTGSIYYSAYHKNPLTAYENSTNKRDVSTSVAGYLYWHWCRGGSSGPINRRVSDGYTSEFHVFHAFTSGALGYNGSAGAFQCSNSGACLDTYWWLAQGCWNGNQLPVYRCNYTDYRKLFNYYKWSDFSEWSTTPVTASANRKVETRTVYRYQPDEMMKEDTSGEEREVKGTLGEAFAGKEASLFIYKVDEASDYTNEYVAQTVLDESGNYDFKFKLREEPSAKTGDFTIALGVEGTSTAIYLDKIEAPKPEYTVNYYDYDGKLILSTKAKQGENAQLPDESKLIREGYTFTKWSESNTNITSNRDIYAEYKINEYNVVFVDWNANTVNVKKFEYGAQLVAPQADDPEDGMTVEWDAIADGKLTVTSDMVVCTRYAKKKYNVTIKDFDNKVISTDVISHGEAVSLPDMKSDDDKIFLGWEDVSDGEEAGVSGTLIKKNVILCPVYVYKETTQNPTADIKGGEYTKKQTVALSCDTKGADIYYTLDGTNPKGQNGILYTEPISIDDATQLQFYACKAGMNDSEVQTELYAVNYEGAMSKWTTLGDLPEEVKKDMEGYEVYTETGYRYKDVKKVTTSEEASQLESAGWQVDEDAQEEYTDYSDWSSELPEEADECIETDVDTKDVYKSAYQYMYSHYAYEDGTTTKYAPKEEEGKECTLQKTDKFDKALSIAGFEDDIPYYIYDGQKWYNQERVSGQIKTGTNYRWRAKKITYYKWTEYSTDDPASDETREMETDTVYSYIRHKSFIVTIHAAENTADPDYSYLAEEGSKIDISNYENLMGYDLVGVYKDAEYTDQWDVENDKVSGSVELYVKYQKQKYTVEFQDEDGNELSTQKIAYMDSAKEPEVPEKAGYKFVGWSSDEYKEVKYDVTVKAKYVAEDEYATVALDNEALTLYEGKTAELTAIVTPSSQVTTPLTWTSSDSKVAEVSDDGKVTALSAGTAVITVTVDETGETAECKVTVKRDINTTLTLTDHTKLSVDDHGFLRGIDAADNTVKNIKNQFVNANIVIKNKAGKELADDAMVGTGSKVVLMKSDALLDEIEIVITGEITGDGVINNRDVSMIARALLDKEVPSDSQILAADVNGDGRVDNKDIALISRSLVGKEKL